MKTNHSIPSTMQAVQLDVPNRKSTLCAVPVPKPKAGQVLIRMAAAQQGLETYVNNMGAGKVLLVANPQDVALDN